MSEVNPAVQTLWLVSADQLQPNEIQDVATEIHQRAQLPVNQQSFRDRRLFNTIELFKAPSRSVADYLIASRGQEDKTTFVVQESSSATNPSSGARAIGLAIMNRGLVLRKQRGFVENIAPRYTRNALLSKKVTHPGEVFVQAWTDETIANGSDSWPLLSMAYSALRTVAGDQQPWTIEGSGRNNAAADPRELILDAGYQAVGGREYYDNYDDVAGKMPPTRRQIFVG